MPIFNNKSANNTDKKSVKSNRHYKIRRYGESIFDNIEDIEQIIRNDETFNLMINAITDGVIVINPDGYITQCNKVVERIMEFDPGEAIGKHVSLIYTQWKIDSLARTTELMDKIFSEKKPYRTKNTVAINTKKHNKRNVDIAVTPILLKDKRCLGYIVTCQDKTDTVRMEEEIMNSKKLESVGLLAGGIAHDFNNVLTSIMGNITLAKIYSNPRDKAYEILLEAEKACMQSKDLTQQLLTFSRGGNPIKKVSHIESIITEAADYALRNSKTVCEYHIDDNIPYVEADEAQIGQVIGHLIDNARQAMNDEGIITINIYRRMSEQYRNIVSDTNEYIQIDVTDHGCGIESENLDKIFDPYYTTKNEGNGFGLAISYSIIKKHGGRMFVRSEVGVGTTLTIVLPVSKKAEETNLTESSFLRHKNLSILVMDDEQQIRDITGKLLTLMGHTVEFAADGEQAIAAYKNHLNANQRFDAVIMDLVIPGKMGGEEAVQHILSLDPTAKCIISSGYSTGETMSKYTKLGFKGIITKPFKVEDLIRVLNESI
ncbi:MAG: response regulator [Spirochaetales bacterium]|nr:response regulator [Spirochaetales bacterium]